MKRISGIWTVGLGLLMAGTVWGQGGAYQTNVPEDAFSWALFTHEGETSFDDPSVGGGHGKVSLSEVDAVLTPVYCCREGLALAVGAGFLWDQFDFKNTGDYDGNVDLYMLMLPVDGLYSTENWEFWVNATPGLYSDLKRIGGDDFRVYGHGMATWHWKPWMDLAAGASYDHIFGKDVIYPIGGFSWEIGTDWKVNMFFPMPAVAYAPTEKWLFFAGARPAGGVWNLSDSSTSGDDDFKVEGWRIGLGTEYELARHIWLHIAGGGAIERKYDVRVDNESILDSKADDTWFVRAGFVIR